MERLVTILKTAGISAVIASLAFTAGILFNIANPYGIPIKPAPEKVITIVKTVENNGGVRLKSKAGDCSAKPVSAGAKESAASTVTIPASGESDTSAELSSRIAPIPPVEKLKDLPRLNLEKAKQYFDSGKYRFVDARPQYKYIEARIKGAETLSASFFNKQFPGFSSKVKPEEEIVIYCSSQDCRLSEIVAGELLDKGYKNLNIFEGGWAEWEAKKYPIEGVKAGK